MLATNSRKGMGPSNTATQAMFKGISLRSSERKAASIPDRRRLRTGGCLFMGGRLQASRRRRLQTTGVVGHGAGLVRPIVELVKVRVAPQVPEFECQKIEFLILHRDRGVVAPMGGFREIFSQRCFQGSHNSSRDFIKAYISDCRLFPIVPAVKRKMCRWTDQEDCFTCYAFTR